MSKKTVQNIQDIFTNFAHQTVKLEGRDLIDRKKQALAGAGSLKKDDTRISYLDFMHREIQYQSFVSGEAQYSDADSVALFQFSQALKTQSVSPEAYEKAADALHNIMRYDNEHLQCLAQYFLNAMHDLDQSIGHNGEPPWPCSALDSLF